MNTSLSLKRVAVLAESRMKSYYYNYMIASYLVFPLIFTTVLVILVRKLSGGEISSQQLAMFINIGSLMNVAYVAQATPATLLAEEKEKNTLRVLMVSSVTGLEIFIGNILPLLLVCGVVQGLLIPFAGIHLSGATFAMYLFVSLIGIAISAVLGLCFGILAKNQMNAMLITMPLSMLLLFIPFYQGMSDKLAKLSHYLYTGIISDTIPKIVSNQEIHLGVTSWLVLLGELLVSILWFLYLYKRNGFDKE